MAKSNLFNIPVPQTGPSQPPVAAEVPTAVVAATPSAAGVFTAQQSAITFAGAPAAVTVVWKVLAVAVPSLASSKLFPVLLSLVVGVLIYWQSATAGVTRKEKILGFVFALINSFAIAAATLGIDAAVSASSAPTPPSGP